MVEKRKKVTIPEIYAMVERGERITFLTAYDYPTALLEDCLLYTSPSPRD